MRVCPLKTLILLTSALGVSCGEKENSELEQPDAANQHKAVTPKPEVTDETNLPPQPAQPTPIAPKPLPPALVAAWEKAGFQAGWMGLHKRTGVHMFSENLEDLDSSKAVPAYKTRIWKTGILESLPAPTMVSFPMDLLDLL